MATRPAAGSVVIRPRQATDVPALARALLAQQAETRYPFRDPLPMPVEDFLHAHDAQRAWTAELDGEPVGHACRVGPPAGFPEADTMNELCARAHGCEPAQLTWVSALFVAAPARGLGIARQLLTALVDDARASGLRPCLEVLAVHPAAMSLYSSTGWQTIHRMRPGWLDGAGEEVPDVAVMVLPDPPPIHSADRF